MHVHPFSRAWGYAKRFFTTKWLHSTRLKFTGGYIIEFTILFIIYNHYYYWWCVYMILYVDHLEMELDDTETSVGNFTWPDSIAWHGDWIAVCHTQTVMLMFTEETEEMSGALFWDHFLLHAYFGPWGVNEKKEIQHTGIRNALTPRHFEACMEPIRPADI